MTDKIQKFFNKLDQKTKKRIRAKLEAIKANPFSGKDIKKLKGWHCDAYRVRVGDLRIIYSVAKNKEIEIIDIDFRGNIY